MTALVVLITLILGLGFVVIAAAVHHLRRLADAAVRQAQAAEVHVVVARRNLDVSERMAAAVAAPKTVATPVTTMNRPGRVQ